MDLASTCSEYRTEREVEDVGEGEILDISRLPWMSMMERVAYIATDIFLL
jgi:hypothetical protein